MALEGIPINSGTGPTVLVDQSGTAYAQIVKIAQGADGTFSLADTLAISGTASVTFVGTPAVTAANVTIASITTGTVNVVGNIATLSNVLTVGTLLGTVAVSGGGGGVQYSAGDTSIAATGTGTLVMGVQSGATTARGMVITTTGGLIIGSMPAVGGGQQYAVNSTGMANTGTGTLIIGMQTGATTGRGLAVTTTGAMLASLVGTSAVTAANVTVASLTTGTVNVVNVLSASGITVASLTTGTMNVVNVLSASGVTIASITAGTVNASLMATTAIAGAFVRTAHASVFNAFVLATTSAAAGVIVKTSGAHTLYITDLLISVAGSMNVQVCSETTAMGQVFLPTTGGFVMNMAQALICTTAQSLRVILSSSGSCGVTVAGYTVT